MRIHPSVFWIPMNKNKSNKTLKLNHATAVEVEYIN